MSATKPPSDLDDAIPAGSAWLRLAQEASGIGHWDWNFASNTITLSREASAMLGLPVEASLDMLCDAWPRICHPDDRAGFDTAIREAVESRTSVLAEVRIRKSGSGAEYRRVLVRGHPDRDRRPRMLGELIDVTEHRHAQAETAAALAMFRRVTEAAPGLLYVYDLASNEIRHLNHGYAEYMANASAEGVEAADALMASVHPEDVEALARHRQACRVLKDRAVAQITFRIRHRDGGLRWLSSRDTPFARTADGMTSEILCYAQDISDLRRATETLQRLTRKIMTVQDDERRRIARDLHDSTVQNLLGAALALQTVQNRIGTSPDLEDALQLIGSSQREIRTLSYLLYPPLLEEMGLQAALAWFADGFTKRTGIQLRLDMPNAASGFVRLPLPTEAETAMYRVAQEALANAYRHANATIVTIALQLDEGSGTGPLVRLRITDDGSGMEASANGEGRAAGLGLASMDERMRAVGGTFSIRSQPGQGTTIEVTRHADPDARIPPPPGR